MANAIAIVMVVYSGVGAAFGLYFVHRGAARLEARAGTAPLGARLLWAPGAAVLWPLLLARCIGAERRGTSTS